ncbi:MAG: energy transducer TonB, partial [Eudoraea sp.]|nr:energy transducer TonB [Eudoraea sp.]
MRGLQFLILLCLSSMAYGQEIKVYTTRDVSSLPYFNEIPCADNGTEECFKNQMKAHTIAHFEYPKSALEKRKTGKVYVQFVVDTTGTITNIKSRSLEKVFENEGLRIVKQIPKLQPALLDGKAVAMTYA